MRNEMRIAKTGEEISPRAASKLRKTTHFFERILTSKEACTIAPKSESQNGQWVCVDCGEVFQNNMQAHGHTSSHRRAWWTGERFEEP